MADASFELRDDLVGDAGVNVFTFVRVVHSVAPFPAFKKLHFLVPESALQGRTGRHRAERTRSSSQTLDGAKGGSDSGFLGEGMKGLEKAQTQLLMTECRSASSAIPPSNLEGQPGADVA
jgi:hypothetical protein